MVSLRFRENLWSGIVAIVMGLIVRIIIPYQIKIRAEKLSNAIPSDYVPLLIVYLMIGLGIVLVMKSLVLKIDSYITVDIPGELHALRYFLIIVVYVIAMPILGFLASSLLFCTGALLFMKIRKKSYYAFTLGITAFLWFSFKYLLNVPLP